MSNDEIVVLMKEGFNQINNRLDKIESKVDPLIEFKAKHEGSNANGKYILVTVMSALAIIIGLINLYIKYK